MIQILREELITEHIYLSLSVQHLNSFGDTSKGNEGDKQCTSKSARKKVPWPKKSREVDTGSSIHSETTSRK
jgi:hypothetical protein